MGPILNLEYYLKTKDYTVRTCERFSQSNALCYTVIYLSEDYRLHEAQLVDITTNCRKNHFARQGQGHTTVNESVILLNLQHGSQDWEVGGVSIFLDLKCAQSNTMQHPT